MITDIEKEVHEITKWIKEARKSLTSMALNVRMKYEDAITEYLLDIGDTERKLKIFVGYCLTSQRFKFIIYPSD